MTFLNSAGNIEARPINVSQPSNSEDNDSLLLLGKLESPQPDREESGLKNEKFPHLQIYTTDDNAIIEELKQLGKSSNPGQQESGIQAEGSAAGEAVAKVTQVSRTTRNAACIARYVYRSIYQYVFQIPICKQGCKMSYRTVSFSNGQSVTIAYDCYI